MQKPPTLGATSKVMGFIGPARHGRGDEESVVEFKVGGRRYRLVPVDSPDATESEDASTSTASLLTPRELQIVVLVAEGHVNKQVADVLRISEWTVSTHLRRVFAKLG